MPELNDKERQARAEANRLESEETHRMAAEARAREGNQPPLIKGLTDSIKSKLQNEEMQPGAHVRPS